MIGFPKLPVPGGDDLSHPHHTERVVRLARPFTADVLEQACRAVGFSRPAQSTVLGIVGAQVWKTTTPRSFGSIGETILIEARSPLELVLRSESKLPGIPFMDFRKNSKNVDRLALALGAF